MPKVADICSLGGLLRRQTGKDNNRAPARDGCSASLPEQSNRTQCERLVEESLAMVTSLNPLIGYDAAAAIAKEAFASGKTVRDLCIEKIHSRTLRRKDSDGVVTESELSKALDPRSMTEPESRLR